MEVGREIQTFKEKEIIREVEERTDSSDSIISNVFLRPKTRRV